MTVHRKLLALKANTENVNQLIIIKLNINSYKKKQKYIQTGEAFTAHDTYSTIKID